MNGTAQGSNNISIILGFETQIITNAIADLKNSEINVAYYGMVRLHSKLSNFN